MLGFWIHEPSCYWETGLGRLRGLRRFTSGARRNPFWMEPQVGVRESDVRWETQWLLAQTGDTTFVLLVPLLDHASRFALRGGDDHLVLYGETGDPAEMVSAKAALLVATGSEPYELLSRAAAVVATHFAIPLRPERRVPDFVDHFGWCTWDAFYADVSPEGVRSGLAAFQAGGIALPWMILDDGWQSVRRAPTGETRLASLAPNEVFANDLSSLIREARQAFGLRWFFVWHAYLGYWGGIDPAAFPDGDVRVVAKKYGPGILANEPTWNVRPWGAQVAVPSAAGIRRFYYAYHQTLRAQGVDGVKVDNQAMLEAVCAGQGGRVETHRAFRAALEDSARTHFDGRLINCMSSVSECHYLSRDSAVVRTSSDFFPQKPESHGAHLFRNAHASLWVGEFMLPDWDMFQSKHPAAAFHAAARALSGGPVYVSDKPGEHDFDLLRQLVLPDGSVLRCAQPGRLTRDCLFTDPTREPVLLKIFNRYADRGGIVGLFNAHAPFGTASKLTGETSAADVAGLSPAESHAARAFRSGACWLDQPESRFRIQLAAGEWELVAYARITHGFAAFGLADFLNGGAAIERCEWDDDRTCRIALRAGGRFAAWAARTPREIHANAHRIVFTHDTASGVVSAEIPVGGPVTVFVRWD